MEYITQYIFCYEHEQVYDLIYVFNSLIIRSSSAEFVWFDHVNLSNLILPSQKKRTDIRYVYILSNDKNMRDKTCTVTYLYVWEKTYLMCIATVEGTFWEL